MIESGIAARPAYVGLRPYSPEDSGIFPARERPVEAILTLLTQRKFIGIVGPEGCGKSSLVEAGLFASLQRGFNGPAGRNWAVCRCRPGRAPIKNLAFALGANGVLEEGNRTTPELGRRIEDLIRESNTGIVEAWRRSAGNGRKNLLIFVDQLEDLFVYHSSENAENRDWTEETHFLTNLSRAAASTEVPIFVVIALRSAYISELHVFGRFQQELTAGQYLVPPFRPADFSELFKHAFPQEPAEQKLFISNKIQEAFGSEMRLLPQLQFTLWQSVTKGYNQEEPSFQVDEMQDHHVLAHVFHRDLEQKFQELSTDNQLLMERMCRALLTVENKMTAFHPRQFSLLCEMTEANPEHLKNLILTFSKSDCRYFELMPAFLAPGAPFPPANIHFGDLIGVANPAILRDWERLELWRQSEERSRETYLRLVQDAMRFRQGDTGYLPPLDLELALQWKAQQSPTAAWASRYHPEFALAMAYLEQSEAARKEELAKKEREQKEKLRKWRVMALIILGVSFAVILIIAGFYLDAKNEQRKAREAREIALEAERTAKTALQNEQIETQRADSLFKVALSEAETTKKALAQEQVAKEKALTERRRAEAAVADTRKALAQEERAKREAQRATENEKAANEQVRKALTAEEKATELANNRKQLAELEKEFFTLENELKQAGQLAEVLPKIKAAYNDYLDISGRIHGRVMPNNQLQRLLNQALIKHYGKTEYTETPMRIQKAERGGLRVIAISPDGSMATAGDDGIIYHVSTAGIKKLNTGERMRALYFLDNNRLIAGAFTGSIYSFNGAEVKKIVQGSGKPEDRILAILPGFIDGEVLAVSTRNITRISVKNGRTGTIPLEKPVSAAFAHPGIQLPLLSNADGLWKMDKDGKLYPILDLRNTRFAADAITAFTNFDQWAAVGFRTGRILIFSNATFVDGKATVDAPAFNFLQHKSEVTGITADPTGKYLYSASMDNQIKVYDFNLNREIQRYVNTFEGHKKWVWDLKWLQQKGKPPYLVTADENGHLLKWNTQWTDILEIFD
jgi:hypothetical protein